MESGRQCLQNQPIPLASSLASYTAQIKSVDPDSDYALVAGDGPGDVGNILLHINVVGVRRSIEVLDPDN